MHIQIEINIMMMIRAEYCCYSSYIIVCHSLVTVIQATTIVSRDVSVQIDSNQKK